MTNEMTAEEAVKILKEQQAEFNEKWVDYGRVNKAYNKAIQALEAQPKDAKTYLKRREENYIEYNVEWFLKNWELELEILSGGKIKPTDAVSRSELMKLYKEWQPRLATNVCEFEQALEDLPSVTPKYTDEEIDKAQAVEQAYVDKMVELAVEESRQKWLESFDTSSATKCFEAVNLLKQRLEGEE